MFTDGSDSLPPAVVVFSDRLLVSSSFDASSDRLLVASSFDASSFSSSCGCEFLSLCDVAVVSLRYGSAKEADSISCSTRSSSSESTSPASSFETKKLNDID